MLFRNGSSAGCFFQAGISHKWGYSVPFSVFRKIGLSGAVISPQRESLRLKAVVLDRKKVSMEALGSTFHQVKCWSHVEVSRLGRKLRLGLGACTVVPLKAGARAHGHLLRPAESSAKVVGKSGLGLLAEALGLLEATYTYMFVAVTDDKTCQACMQHDTKVYTQDDIARLFPYAQTVDYSLIMPMCHPHCRCFLVLLEIGA